MKHKLAIHGGKATVTIAKPHFAWGKPNSEQIKALKKYIEDGGEMSIYGDSGIYQKLEEKVKKIYDVKYAILTNSGTSALNSAFFGVGIGRNDEVIVPVYTFLATVTPLLRLGAIPVFTDADPETGNIDAREIEKSITKKTKAVVVTHMWGLPCNMEQITKICKKHKLILVEDCAHAHLTRYSGKLLGTFGNAACFSIGAKKTWTSGEGGFLITDDPEVYLRASLLGHFNMRATEAVERVRKDGYKRLAKKYQRYTTGYGENYRMHPYSAVMALAALTKTLRKNITHRAISLKYLASKLSRIPGIKPPVVNKDYLSGSMYGFKPKLILNQIGYKGPAQKIIDAIRAEGVEMKLPDTLPLCDDPLFIDTTNFMNSSKQKFVLKRTYPGAREYIHGRVSLPTFTGGHSDKKLIDQYCQAITKVMKFYGKAKA